MRTLIRIVIVALVPVLVLTLPRAGATGSDNEAQVIAVMKDYGGRSKGHGGPGVGKFAFKGDDEKANHTFETSKMTIVPGFGHTCTCHPQYQKHPGNGARH